MVVLYTNIHTLGAGLALGNYLIIGVESGHSAVGVVNPLLPNQRDPLAPDPHF